MPPTRILLSAILSALLSPLAAEMVHEDKSDGVTADYQVDAKGVRSGSYTETAMGGKIVLVRGRYRAGEQDGQWTWSFATGKAKETCEYKAGKRQGKWLRYRENGKPMAQAAYANDELVGPVATYDEQGQPQRLLLTPRSAKQVLDILQRWWPAQSLPVTYKTPPSWMPPYAAGSIEQPCLDQALHAVQAYRALSGAVADDLALDPVFNDDDQHGCVVLARRGGLSHTPERIADMDQAFFDSGYRGCNTSNISWVSSGLDATLVGAVRIWMDDSDAANIKALGHRRWVLSPGLQHIGFGSVNNFSAMHVVGGGRAMVPAWDLIAFPGEGCYPIELMAKKTAWSVLLNNERFKLGADVTVEVLPLDEAYQAGEKLPCELIAVDRKAAESFVVFRPDPRAYAPGRYWIRLGGVVPPPKNRAGEAGYFLELRSFAAELAAAKPAADGKGK